MIGPGNKWIEKCNDQFITSYIQTIRWLNKPPYTLLSLHVANNIFQRFRSLHALTLQEVTAQAIALECCPCAICNTSIVPLLHRYATLYASGGEFIIFKWIMLNATLPRPRRIDKAEKVHLAAVFVYAICDCIQCHVMCNELQALSSRRVYRAWQWTWFDEDGLYKRVIGCGKWLNLLTNIRWVKFITTLVI